MNQNDQIYFLMIKMQKYQTYVSEKIGLFTQIKYMQGKGY